MMNRFAVILLLFVVSCLATACDGSHLRGTVSPSVDGKTYLAIDDDNGGSCGPILVDGKIWKHKTSEAGLIAPGLHKIECGGTIQFEIPSGVVFRFNYWGP